MDGAGSYSVAHRAGLLPTELTGMWAWILLRSPHQGRGSPPVPAPNKQRPALELQFMRYTPSPPRTWSLGSSGSIVDTSSGGSEAQSTTTISHTSNWAHEGRAALRVSRRPWQAATTDTEDLQPRSLAGAGAGSGPELGMRPGVTLGEGLALGAGATLEDPASSADGEAVAECDGDADGEANGDADGEAEGEWEGDGEADVLLPRLEACGPALADGDAGGGAPPPVSPPPLLLSTPAGLSLGAHPALARGPGPAPTPGLGELDERRGAGGGASAPLVPMLSIPHGL